ncbi:MAG: hypothetical protein KC422_00960, partial [Trueperaceae bacterium]|nr:hypothetical protein [Trueperaceae bacterium]
MPLAFDKADPQIWWGEFAANEGEINKLQIGPSQFWITRYAQEWRIAHLQEEANELAEVKLEPLSQASDIPGEAQINHFSFQQSPKSLFFTPMLADRPVVMKPEHPFYIQSGAEVTIYVTTSLWLRISTGEHSGILRTYPLYRPSDTWFGSSTREGELCYASRIKGRLRLLDVAMLPHRALT